MNSETESVQCGGQMNHKSSFGFESNQQAFLHLLTVARFD